MEDKCLMCGADVSDLSTHICQNCKTKFDICIRCVYFAPFSADDGICKIHNKRVTNICCCEYYKEDR